MEDIGSIRVHGDTYARLKNIKDDDETVEEALERLLEQDVERVERPEDEAVGLTVHESLAERVNEKAGENVSANDVIETLVEKYEDND